MYMITGPYSQGNDRLFQSPLRQVNPFHNTLAKYSTRLSIDSNDDHLKL